jgi:phosphomannomutase
MQIGFSKLERIIKLIIALIFGEVDDIRVTSQNRQQYLNYLKDELEETLFHGYKLQDGWINRAHDYIEFHLFQYGHDRGLVRLSKYTDKIVVYFEKPNLEIDIPLD